MDEEKIKKLYQELLKEIGEDPSREGLRDTPGRVARMFGEVFKGYDQSKKPSITTFNNNTDGVASSGLVCDKGYFYSHCEHHGVPFFGEYYFGYIPNKKIIGLSKVARIVDYCSSKLQVQERLNKQIIDELQEILQPKAMILVMKARHLCKEMRGIKIYNGEMTTSEITGSFKTDDNHLKEEFFELMKLR